MRRLWGCKRGSEGGRGGVEVMMRMVAGVEVVAGEFFGGG